MPSVIKRNSWQIWRDVIFALFVREIRTGFSDKVGIAWSVVNPLSFIFFMSYIRSLINGGYTHTVPTFEFMFYGMLLIQLFMSTVSSVERSISKNKALFAFRQVQPISSIIAAALFELLVKIFVVLSVFVLAFILNIKMEFDNPLGIIFNFLLVWLFSIALGTLFSLAECWVPEFSKLVSIAMRPMFFISGAFFSLQDISPKYWKYLDWNPILHAIELTRGAAYSTYNTDAVSEVYLNVIALVFFMLALCVYYVFWKRAISR